MLRSETKKFSQVCNVYVMWENFVFHFATAKTESLEKRTLGAGSYNKRLVYCLSVIREMFRYVILTKCSVLSLHIGTYHGIKRPFHYNLGFRVPCIYGQVIKSPIFVSRFETGPTSTAISDVKW